MKLFSYAAFMQWLILARTQNYQGKSIAVKHSVPGLIFIYSKKRGILHIGPGLTEARFLSKDDTTSFGVKSSRVSVTFAAEDIDVSGLLSISMVGLKGRLHICCILA